MSCFLSVPIRSNFQSQSAPEFRQLESDYCFPTGRLRCEGLRFPRRSGRFAAAGRGAVEKRDRKEELLSGVFIHASKSRSTDVRRNEDRYKFSPTLLLLSTPYLQLVL
jgi:hypothetical protein